MRFRFPISVWEKGDGSQSGYQHGTSDPTAGRHGCRDERAQRKRRARPTGRGPNPRKPWLALLLGILVPTAGFAYVGRLGMFIAMGVGVFGSIVLLGRVGMLQTLAGVWGMALAVAFEIACIVLPWQFARAERSYRLRWYNC